MLSLGYGGLRAILLLMLLSAMANGSDLQKSSDDGSCVVGMDGACVVEDENNDNHIVREMMMIDTTAVDSLGVEQELLDAASKQLYEKSKIYMTETVYGDESFAPVREKVRVHIMSQGMKRVCCHDLYSWLAGLRI